MHRIALTLAALCFSGAAAAQESPAPNAQSDMRFQLERADGGGFVRLDRQTGTMSFCRLDGGNLDCQAGADERAALQDEINRLAAEVDRLKAGGAGADAKDENSLTLKLPSEKEVDQVMGFFEDMFRRFMAMVRGLEQDQQKERM